MDGIPHPTGSTLHPLFRCFSTAFHYKAKSIVDLFSPQFDPYLYCDEFAQGIAGQQPVGQWTA
jgi:hypothetical protein